MKKRTKGGGLFGVAALCTALLSFSFFSARASNLIGGDMSITQYEKGKFAIRVYVYLDCSVNSSSLYSAIIVKSKCGNYNHSGGSASSGSLDITPVCSNGCSKCSSSSCTFGLGVSRIYFDDTVDLSNVTCSEFIVSWEGSHRTYTITTGAANKYLYLEGRFYKDYFKEKTSVFFDSAPLLIAGKSRCTASVQSIAQEGYDSVSYKLVSPLEGPGSVITYNPGYSFESPLKFDGYPDTGGAFNPPTCKGFHLNENTGELNFKPTGTDITTVVVEATAWVKDTKGSYNPAAVIRRDIAVNIIDMSDNRSPVIQGFNCLKSNTIHICAGGRAEATICTFDPDIDDTVHISLDTPLPGATLAVEKGKKWPKGVFLWDADTTLVRKEPYMFVVTVSDNACPTPATYSKIFYVYIDKKKTSFTLKKTGSCNKYTFKADSGSSSAAGATYQWLINGKPAGSKPELTYRFDTSGKYPVKLIISQGCDQAFYDTIEIKRPQLITISKTEPEEGDTIKLTGNGGQKFTWWKGKDTLSHSTELTVKTPPGKNYYHVLVEDTTGKCDWHDSILVKGYTMVWPGDVDRDGEANYKDLLTLGLGTGSGERRQDTSTTWSAKKAITWGKKVNGVDYAHLDCDGDGWIFPKDTNAILRNYDPKRETSRTSNSSGAPISFVFSDSVLLAGSKAVVNVYLGSASTSLSNLNGLAFSYEYPEKYLAADPSIKWYRRFGIGTQNSGQWQMYRSIAAGYAEASVSCPGKIPHSFTQPTLLAQLVLQLKDTTQYTYDKNGEWMKLSFFNFYAIDTSGKKISLTAIDDSVLVRKPAPDEIVYPGDADNNLQADYRDLLSLGIGFGTAGTPRTEQGTAWKGYRARPWEKRTFSADYAHLDCNGDGTIDVSDISAITKNYDQTRENVRSSTSLGTPLEFQFEKDTLYAGDNVLGHIYAGSPSQPLNGINGLCFSYERSTELDRTGSYVFYSWTTPFPLYLHKSISPGYGEASYTAKGKDPLTLSTTTEISRIQFRLKDSIQHSYPDGGEWVKFSFYNFYAVDSFGRKIPMKAIDDSVLVLRHRAIKDTTTIDTTTDTTTSIRFTGAGSNIKIYPNPATNEVFVQSDGKTMNGIVFINAIGEVLIRKTNPGKKFRIESGHLKPGVYFVQVQMSDGVVMQKLIIR